ncbi:MAG: transcription factor S [Candidatus Woesearchaeota archaeon]
MKFCPKCGSLLLPKKDEKGKNYLLCRCGYTENVEKNELKINETIKDKKDINTIEEEVEIHPISNNVECPKCLNKSAYFWEIQTRASDEPATKFFKCTKCKHIWRDYN